MISNGRNELADLGKRPVEILKAGRPYLGHLCVLKCRVWVYISKETRKKLERSYQGIPVCYEGKNQYLVHDPRRGQFWVT